MGPSVDSPRGELRWMDLGFVRYTLEMAQLKKCQGYMPVESKDVEAFQASGFECHKIIGS